MYPSGRADATAGDMSDDEKSGSDLELEAILLADAFAWASRCRPSFGRGRKFELYGGYLVQAFRLADTILEQPDKGDQDLGLAKRSRVKTDL